MPVFSLRGLRGECSPRICSPSKVRKLFCRPRRCLDTCSNLRVGWELIRASYFVYVYIYIYISQDRTKPENISELPTQTERVQVPAKEVLRPLFTPQKPSSEGTWTLWEREATLVSMVLQRNPKFTFRGRSVSRLSARRTEIVSPRPAFLLATGE